MSSIDNSTRTNQQKEISNIQSDFSRKKKQIAKENEMQLSELQDYYDEKKQDAHSQGEAIINHIKKSDEKNIQSAYERSHEINEKYLSHVNNLQKKYDELNSENQNELIKEQASHDQKVQKLEKDSAQRYEKNKMAWVHTEQRLNDEYSSRLDNNKRSYEKELKNQNEHFQSTFKNNEAAQNKSLQTQNEKYEKQIKESARKFLVATEAYKNKEDDPFYKVQDRGSTLLDRGNYYVLKAYVPEHEKDAVKVIIEKDKAIVSGERSFKDKIKDDEKTVSTNSFQTFREEFPFEKAVLTEGMTRERDGDYVVYRIPIVNGSQSNEFRYSRKA